MDKAVLDAIERWPNVPAVFGWLSLSRRGQWRLHPGGTALAGGYGESIQNQQILSFMDRNYACDDQGRWFFQNGPQKVFVRLDSAPYIVSLTGQPALLRTHNQLEVQRIDDWLIDRDGNLFLRCDHGAASINDLDLELVAKALQTETGQDVLSWWEDQRDSGAQTLVHTNSDSSFSLKAPVRLRLLGQSESAASALGFVANPGAEV